MNLKSTLFVGALLCVTWLPALAEPVDAEGDVLCAMREYFECAPVHGCDRVRAEQINAPEFVAIDFDDGTLTGSFGNTTAFRHETHADGSVALQGIEGFGWTLTLNPTNGHFSAAVPRGDVAFLMFGSCRADD
jgi:hypothetical protein